MDRGAVSKTGSHEYKDRYFSHTFWHGTPEKKQKTVEYVAGDKVAALEEDIKAHKAFLELVQEYESLVIQETRRARGRGQWKKPRPAKIKPPLTAGI